MEPDTIDWDEKIEKVATRISNLGLETPAMFLLDAHMPLTFFANQGLIFLSPILYPLFGEQTEVVAKFFEERKNVEKLVRRIEEKANQRLQNERSARAMHKAMRRARRQARRGK